jgi:ABC-2 type transport system permease protein
MRFLANTWRLGIKELWSLWRDPIMLVFVAYTFTVSIYTTATAMPDVLHHAPIAIVDEDASPLSARIVSAFYQPNFTRPVMLSLEQVDAGMDAGTYTFVLVLPHGLQRDVLAGKVTTIQLDVDATRMSQAFTGSGDVQQIVDSEVAEFTLRHRPSSAEAAPPVDLAMRTRFNPSLEMSWFGSVMGIINNITMVSILLTGAALIREREHGTIEHLLVMPVTPGQIMSAKVWSMGLVVLLSSAAALVFVVQWALAVTINGSVPLFLACAALTLFATTSIGIFMATLTRSMPQFALALVLVLLPLQMLSGGSSPTESMPMVVQKLMLVAPTTHFVSAAQAILYRGAGFDVVWPRFAANLVIGGVFFTVALLRFRKTITQMA